LVKETSAKYKVRINNIKKKRDGYPRAVEKRSPEKEVINDRVGTAIQEKPLLRGNPSVP